MIRAFSLFLRKLQAKKERKRILTKYSKWKKIITLLPSAITTEKKLLIIRLDDIGDYLLSHNLMAAFRESGNWKDHTITMLGNVAWKEFYLLINKDIAEKEIWVNKKEYFTNEDYRNNLWKQLKADGYTTVICLSRTRPLLLDDMCAFASGALTKIGCENTYEDTVINSASNNMFSSLFKNDTQLHEFFFNQSFTNWCCDSNLNISRPFIPNNSTVKILESPYILCNLGANAKSRRWDVNSWIQYIRLCRISIPQFTLVLAGSEADLSLANEIKKEEEVNSIVGQTTLEEMIPWTYGASVVVCNNSMAAHLGVCCNTSTVIISSGDNFPRFAEYEIAGIKNVTTVYPPVFLRKWKQKKYKLFWYYTAVSKDIKTIKATLVFKRTIAFLNNA